MYGYIYKTTNLIDGKIYVGKHKGSEFKESYKGSGKLLRFAIEKYGWDNFSCEILEWCEDKDSLSAREKFWIKELNSQDRSIGYNIADGGWGGYTVPMDGEKNPFYGKHHTEETKEQISCKLRGHITEKQLAWRKGHKWSDEAKASCSIRMKGEKNPFYGKHHTEETKERIRKTKIEQSADPDYKKRMSDAHKGVKLSESHKRNIGLASKKNNVKMYHPDKDKYTVVCIASVKKLMTYGWMIVEDKDNEKDNNN